LRSANNGQTLSRIERASAAFLAAGLARKVEPVTVSRFIMMWRQSTVTLLPCRKRDDRHPALQRQALQILLDVIAADDIEDDVDAALGGDRGDFGGEVLLPVVDRMVGADRLQNAALSSLPTVVMVMAPKACASWIAASPMPPEPPWINTVSPAFRWTRSKRLFQTVK
jgi:hypothetical protein